MRRMIKLDQIEWLNGARAKEERINKAYGDVVVSHPWNVESYSINIATDEDNFIFSGYVTIEQGEDDQAAAVITITGLPHLGHSGILVATNSLGGSGAVEVNTTGNAVTLNIAAGANREVYFSGMISKRQFDL